MGTQPGRLILAALIAAIGLGHPAVNAAQDGVPAAPVSALRDRIELAYQALDLEGIESARQELLSLGGDRAGYFAAYARFRQALAAEGDDPAARGYLEDCIRELGTYVGREPADAEARALLGSCYGISTRYNRLGMASRGLEARRHMAAARELAPENPWVMLQDGLADEATPRLFGGDKRLALTKIERAAALFAVAMADGSRLAAWGAAEAWSQLGRIYDAAGRPDEARAALSRAAELAPARVAPPAQVASSL
jgi:tetratricopeptide (TPR) repeat protein